MCGFELAVQLSDSGRRAEDVMATMGIALWWLASHLLLVSGQLEPPFISSDLGNNRNPNERLDQSAMEDFFPISRNKEERFLEGLIVEAGRHVLFPELYEDPLNEMAVNNDRPFNKFKLQENQQREEQQQLQELQQFQEPQQIQENQQLREEQQQFQEHQQLQENQQLLEEQQLQEALAALRGPVFQQDVSDIKLDIQKESEVVDSKKYAPFYEIKGQPEFEEQYTNRRIRAECPEECPMYKPVCGTDGKMYNSECHLLKENCGQGGVRAAVGWRKCREKHYICPFRCLNIHDPVCGSDGRMYRNICIMRQNNCGKLLHVLPVSKCSKNYQEVKVADSCPEECPEIPKPSCGSNGVIYYNECFLRMRTCKEGVSEVGMEQCATLTTKCPQGCLSLYDPVCGSDKKIYTNKCMMFQQNCGKNMKQMPSSFCRSDGQGSPVAP